MQKGFTLIETLIYLALFSIIIGGFLVTAFQIIQGNDSAQQKAVIEEESNFLLRKIDWALSGVGNINIPPSGLSGSTLSVTKPGLPVGQNPLVFNFNSGNIQLQRGAGASTILNSSNVTISNLLFNHIPASAQKPEAVKASFNIGNRVFETTKYLRK